MNERMQNLCAVLLGRKRFEIIKILCQRADENGFVFCKIDELSKELNISKPTIISTFGFLEEKKLFKRLKNGFYQLRLDRL
ncbi:ArsR family transcriptional regulator [Campylobacter sp. MIT 12-8780]|uniref:replication/maintenance protein RepL n=2 Tax=Campylobacter TaxID=194 RepID=UPI0010F5FA37|nr:MULTISPECIES: replication/maintenance protein RepL [unclassified Campylobacter]NDJ27662.1 ArsR family transcriptional regulator [Campylobacter sp. MIT 19-121]TKX29779.1 ArsR family transcriptional regulator [Campylobacter sp. MIT 12-5580]TQR40826.1 ArsR family transcriptional regulator [Campylobacter sp. MIT 12-8780]